MRAPGTQLNIALSALYLQFNSFADGSYGAVLPEEEDDGIIPPGSPDQQQPGPFNGEGSLAATSSNSELKAALVDSTLYTDRGLSASALVRAEINELVLQLEAANPTPSPTTDAALLDGEWRLVYTANSELIPLLALGRLPFLRVGDITQAVDVASMSVKNKFIIESPLASGTLGANATFEARAPLQWSSEPSCCPFALAGWDQRTSSCGPLCLACFL